MKLALGGIHSLFSITAAVLSLLFSAGDADAATLELRPSGHICLVGNALGERMQFGNSWKTLLYQRFPKHYLVVRNPCFPGDEPFTRDRSLNFGEPKEHLEHSKADVILFFFGFNESFAGPSDLERFAIDLTPLVEETKNYSSKGAPRMALVSPIAHEDLGDPNLTNGKPHNADLEKYADAMRQVAEQTEVGFVDLSIQRLGKPLDVPPPNAPS
jgi:hypothetical protein